MKRFFGARGPALNTELFLTIHFSEMSKISFELPAISGVYCTKRRINVAVTNFQLCGFPYLFVGCGDKQRESAGGKNIQDFKICMFALTQAGYRNALSKQLNCF